jgi:hypothetical protein
LQYPHILRKARPVTGLMIHKAVDAVPELQLPLLQLEDGAWLQGMRLDSLRNSVWLQLLSGLGRRAGGHAASAVAATVFGQAP